MGGLEPIGKIIHAASKRAQIEPQVNAAQTLELYRSWVSATFGPEFAKEVRPATVRSGTMHVFVKSGPLLTELRIHEVDALRCLESAKQKIKRIVYEHELIV